MTEEEKMLAGRIYDCNDEFLKKRRLRAHKLCREYNATDEEEVELRSAILSELLPHMDKTAAIQGPIFCDYGTYIQIGARTFANFNLTILDVCLVKIGSNVFFGPNVSIYSPIHPLDYRDRNIYFDSEKNYFTDREYGAGVIIEDDCWIAGSVTICGGVKIGRGSVIGAGSVVVKDIPENSLAVGNPCRVIRKIEEKDRIKIDELSGNKR